MRHTLAFNSKRDNKMKSGLLKSLVLLSINTFTEMVSYVQEEFNDVNSDRSANDVFETGKAQINFFGMYIYKECPKVLH